MNTKIKRGMTFTTRKTGKKGYVDEPFDRDRWDEPHDPEWYVRFEDGGLLIVSESTMKSSYAFDAV
jgi:hypothetical protein